MKKMFNLLVVLVLSMVIVACGGFELKKNPHIKRVEYSKVDLEKATSWIKSTKVRTVDTSGDMTVSDFTGFEDNILISVLETEYKGLTFRNLIAGISEQLGEKCIVEIAYSKSMGGGTITFLWGDGNVAISAGLEIRKDGYSILEVPSFVVETMKKIWNSKDIPNFEKEQMIQREYKGFWEPSIVIFGEIVDMENPKYLEIIDMIKSRVDYLSVDKVDNYETSNYEIMDGAPVEFLEEISTINQDMLLPFNHMGETIDSLCDEVYDRLDADRAVVNAMSGNMMGAFLSVTYYKGRKEIATLYFMLDMDLTVTEDISLEFTNGKTIKGVDVIHYARKIK